MTYVILDKLDNYVYTRKYKYYKYEACRLIIQNRRKVRALSSNVVVIICPSGWNLIYQNLGRRIRAKNDHPEGEFSNRLYCLYSYA